MSAPAVKTLLLQAQALLNDADEANHGGHVVTYDLQRQAREVLAEAIDALGDIFEKLAAGADEADKLEAHLLLESFDLGVELGVGVPRNSILAEKAKARFRAFPDARAGMRWWNSLSEALRRYWLDCAGSARPADAWLTYRASSAYSGDQRRADAWDAAQDIEGAP